MFYQISYSLISLEIGYCIPKNKLNWINSSFTRKWRTKVHSPAGPVAQIRCGGKSQPTEANDHN